jgi:hypothetical protein
MVTIQLVIGRAVMPGTNSSAYRQLTNLHIPCTQYLALSLPGVQNALRQSVVLLHSGALPPVTYFISSLDNFLPGNRFVVFIIIAAVL